jgi:very-short-patch-repair endonuclease
LEESDNSHEKANIKHEMFLGANPKLFAIARELRLDETEAEKLLWSKLSHKQLGVRFRRQHPIYSYVVDFYCHSHRLVVEVDGPIHETEENKSYDASRTEGFREFDIKVLRFTNKEVIDDVERVIEIIKQTLR